MMSDFACGTINKRQHRGAVILPLRFSQRTCSARPGELFTTTGGVPPAIAPQNVILSHVVVPGQQLEPGPSKQIYIDLI